MGEEINNQLGNLRQYSRGFLNISWKPRRLVAGLILIIFWLFVICHSFSYAKEYDGVWFLGFNTNKDIFGDDNGKVVRQAVLIAIDRNKIANKIIKDDVTPIGVIPPGMEGYDASLEAYPHDLGVAKKMMRSAGYPLSDIRLKTISFLHTDGERTIQIVNQIKIDLINLGFDIQTTVVPYANNALWQKELASGKYHMYVMGYKSGNLGQIFIADQKTGLFHNFTCPNSPTNEADIAYFNNYEDAVKAEFQPCPVCKPEPEKAPNTLALLQPLFYSEGEANFTHYNNKRLDILLEDLSRLDESLKISRSDKLDEISRIIWEDVPVVPLFYITKL